jgi:hypothetical protein
MGNSVGVAAIGDGAREDGAVLMLATGEAVGVATGEAVGVATGAEKPVG